MDINLNRIPLHIFKEIISALDKAVQRPDMEEMAGLRWCSYMLRSRYYQDLWDAQPDDKEPNPTFYEEMSDAHKDELLMYLGVHHDNGDMNDHVDMDKLRQLIADGYDIDNDFQCYVHDDLLFIDEI